MTSIFEKISKIEALIERSSSDGEREAARQAKERILKSQTRKPKEYTVSSRNQWHKKLFVSLCHKHNLSTYRYKRQKYTTTMVHVSPEFMNEVLWPEFEKYGEMLEALVQDIVESLIAKIYKGDQQEMEITGEIGHTPKSTQEVSGVPFG